MRFSTAHLEKQVALLSQQNRQYVSSTVKHKPTTCVDDHPSSQWVYTCPEVEEVCASNIVGFYIPDHISIHSRLNYGDLGGSVTPANLLPPKDINPHSFKSIEET